MRPVLPLLALALVAGCSSRDHANPFDPQNPATRGRPPGFVALAGSQFVKLSWSRPSLSGDFGYRLFRRVEGEADFTQIGSDFGSSTVGTLDFGLRNGVTCEYRLYYLFGGVMGGLPAEDAATPGPLRPWLADLGRRSLIGVTPDDRHIAQETGGFLGPTHVAVDPERGLVWISDTYNGAVVILDPTTGGRFSVRVFAEPVAIALDPLDGSAWICDQALNAVFHYKTSGDSATPGAIRNLKTPIGVAIDPATGTVWVCEKNGNQVSRFTRGTAPLGLTAIPSPSRVAVDSLTGDAWVTSADAARVSRVASNGAFVSSLALVAPVGVAVDPRRDRIWVADAGAGQVVSVTRGAMVEFRLGGLGETRDVAVDLATGEAWVTAPGVGAVVRVSPAGAMLQRLTGLSEPYGIALDPGTARGP